MGAVGGVEFVVVILHDVSPLRQHSSFQKIVPPNCEDVPSFTDVREVRYYSVVTCFGVNFHHGYPHAAVMARLKGKEFHCCTVCRVAILTAPPLFGSKPHFLRCWEQSAHPDDAESNIKIGFYEDYVAKAMDKRVPWLFFEHYF